MTRYIAAYDTENIDHALEALPPLIHLHRKYEIPATFFVVGRLLEQDGPKYRELLDDPLFDIQTHTYSHQMLKDSRPHGPAVSLEEMEIEVGRGKQLVEDVFEREVIGLRPGCGFENGFTGAPERLEIIRRHGLKYVSADLRGPLDAIPASMKPAYTYEADGYGDIWEIPGHGWHDNVLKGATGHITFFPPIYEFAMPPKNPETVVDIFAQEGRWIEHAVELGLDFVSLVQHPWSLCSFDEKISTIDLLLVRAQQLDMTFTTYTQYYRELAGEA